MSCKLVPRVISFQAMKSTVLFSVIATLLCVIQRSESAVELNELLVRPDIYDKHPSLFKIARNTWEQDRLKHFVQVPLEHGFPYKLRLFCYPKDPRFCTFYDFLGNIAGVQISFLKADVQNVSPHVYNYTAVKDFVHTNFFGIPAYSSRIYFTQPDILTEAGRQDVSEVAEGLWTTIDRKLVYIPRCQPNGRKLGTFEIQGCHPRMGTGFVNKFGPFDTCNEGYFMFITFHDNSLVSFGVFAPGYGSPGPLRDWYSHATEESIKLLLPGAPPCINDMKKYKFSAIVVFLIDNLKTITCSKCLQA